MKIKNIRQKISTTLWYLSVIILFTLVFVVSLLRAVLPELDSLTPKINAYFIENNLDVSLGYMNGEWKDLHPVIIIRDFVKDTKEGDYINFYLDEARIEINFWQSLFSRELIINHFSMTKVGVDIKQREKQENQNNTELQNAVNDFLLSNIRHYSMKQFEFSLNLGETEFIPIYFNEFEWQNDEIKNKSKGQGLISLKKEYNQNEIFFFAMELNKHPNNYRLTNFYLKADDYDLNPLLSWVFDKDINYFDSGLSFEGWFDLDVKGLYEGLLLLGDSYASWMHNNKEYLIKTNEGALRWLPTDRDQVLVGKLISDNLSVNINDKLWDNIDIFLERKRDSLSFWLNSMPAEIVEPFLSLYFGEDHVLYSDVSQLDLHGTLGPLKLQNKDNVINIQMPFNDLQWNDTLHIPGIDDVSGTLYLVDNILNMSVDTENVLFSWKSKLPKSAMIDTLKVEIDYDIEKNTIVLENLHVDNEDFDINAVAKLSNLSDNLHLSLDSNIDISNINVLKKYLPREILKQDLIDYLNDTLLSGSVNNGKIVWEGDIPEFPYENDLGIFIADFNIQNIQYQFLEDWPLIKEGGLYTVFRNDGLNLTLHDSYLGVIPIKLATIDIENFGNNSKLIVETEALTLTNDIVAILKNNQLYDSLGKILENIKTISPLLVKFKLFVPLGDELKNKEEIVAQGEVIFEDDYLKIIPLDLELNDTYGKLYFTNSEIKADIEHANIYNQDVQLTIEGYQKPDDIYYTYIDFTSKWILEDKPSMFDNPLDPFLDGIIDLNGDVALTMKKDNLSYELNVHSDLKGLSSSLPKILGKEKEEQKALHLNVQGDNTYGKLNLSLDKNVELLADFYALNRNFRLKTYQFNINTHQPLSLLEGGYIFYDNDTLVYEEWQDLIEAFSQVEDKTIKTYDNILEEDFNAYLDKIANNGRQEKKDNAVFFPPLKEIHIQTDNAIIFNFGLGKGNIDMYFDNGVTNLNAKLDRFKGTVLLHNDLHDEGIAVRGDYLYLTQLYEKEEEIIEEPASVEDINALPKLDIVINDFKYQDYDLGHLTVQGEQVEKNKYLFKEIQVEKDNNVLDLSGYWTPYYDVSETLLAGSFKTKDIGNFLSSMLKTEKMIDKASFNSTFSFSWIGAPWQFKLENFAGKINYVFGSGSLLQVSDKGARLLSLLSFEALLKKLSLDFSDLFAKGLYFNSIEGKMSINDGVVLTRDSVMDASAGQARITGWTDLSTKEIDYNLSFSPALTSSLPGVVLLSTGALPITIGVFAVFKVLNPFIEVLSKLDYHVTGTLDKPVFNEIKE